MRCVDLGGGGESGRGGVMLRFAGMGRSLCIGSAEQLVQQVLNAVGAGVRA